MARRIAARVYPAPESLLPKSRRRAWTDSRELAQSNRDRLLHRWTQLRLRQTSAAPWRRSRIDSLASSNTTRVSLPRSSGIRAWGPHGHA